MSVKAECAWIVQKKELKKITHKTLPCKTLLQTFEM